MTLTKRTLLLPCLFILFITGSARANPYTSNTIDLKKTQQSITQIQKNLNHRSPPIQQLQQWIDEVSTDRQKAEQCVNNQQSQLQTIKSELSALGSPVKGESWQVTSKRYALDHQQEHTAQTLAQCRLLLVNSKSLYEDLQSRHNQELANKLLLRGRNTVFLLSDFLKSPPPYNDWVSWPKLQNRLGSLTSLNVGLLAMLTVIGLIGGLAWRRHLNSKLQPVDPEKDRSRAIALALLVSLNHYRPGLAITMLWSIFWLIASPDKGNWPLLAALSFELFIYQLALVLIRGIFDPMPPANPHLPIAEKLSRRFGKMLRGLSFNALIGLFLFATPLSKAINVTILQLARSVWGTLFVINLIAVIWTIRRLRYKSGIGLLRTAFSIALFTGLVAEWAGYRNLSQFIVGGAVATLVISLLVWLFTAVVNDVFNSLEEGRHPWEERLRKRLALREDGFVPGIFWLRLLVNIAIWASVAFALLRIWGLSARGQAIIFHYMTHGFTLGKITIVPSRIALALLVLGVLLSLGSWARSALDQRLSHARMERGAREAAVAITGYLAAIIAGLVALSVAGFNFQNLALIAGALSVGIGFGLQNIVNNFVSGLILLFERPIRTGDWITVGQVEGFVRRISIRSTQIQTFDRADVVLPNSDLISGAVTNWMLRDTFGRVRVPVGVSYGTDPELVKETLLNVAHEHPHVIFDNSAIPNPYVLFMSFGDSSLNFELRVYIRDVNDKLLVLSDLNFAVDAAFRKAGITIPFPQRDIHIIRPSSDNTQDETLLTPARESATNPEPTSSGRPPPG